MSLRLNDIKGSLQFSESVALKVVSLILALILWLTIMSLKREEVKKNVKLEPLLPPGMVITNKIPSHILFTLVGPRVLLKDVERKIQPIRPDLRRNREATVGFSVSEELLGDLPSGVRVANFYPPNILIRLEEVIEKYIEVRPVFKGSIADGQEISKVQVSPSKVAVSGAKSLVQSLDHVGTEAMDIADLKGSKEADVAVEVDTSQGYQLSREKIVHIKVHTKRVPR